MLDQLQLSELDTHIQEIVTGEHPELLLELDRLGSTLLTHITSGNLVTVTGELAFKGLDIYAITHYKAIRLSPQIPITAYFISLADLNGDPYYIGAGVRKVTTGVKPHEYIDSLTLVGASASYARIPLNLTSGKIIRDSIESHYLLNNMPLLNGDYQQLAKAEEPSAEVKRYRREISAEVKQLTSEIVSQNNGVPHLFIPGDSYNNYGYDILTMYDQYGKPLASCVAAQMRNSGRLGNSIIPLFIHYKDLTTVGTKQGQETPVNLHDFCHYFEAPDSEIVEAYIAAIEANL